MRNPRDVWGLMLTALVFGHLAVAMAHGQAHRGAEVGLSTAGNVFVWLVIIAGPVLGWLWWKTAGGAAGVWVIAATMIGSLLFGLVNHFLVVSADHVRSVHGPWSRWFTTTAVLLLVTEGLGAGAGVWCAAVRSRRRS